MAEVLWAVQEEMAQTVEDVLARRVRLLFIDAREAIASAPKVAAFMAKTMGKDETWVKEQIDAFNAVASHYYIH